MAQKEECEIKKDEIENCLYSISGWCNRFSCECSKINKKIKTMENLKVEMRPIVGDDNITFKLKIEAIAGAVECEEIIKYLQSRKPVEVK